MGVGAGLYMYYVVVYAISFLDEFLLQMVCPKFGSCIPLYSVFLRMEM